MSRTVKIKIKIQIPGALVLNLNDSRVSGRSFLGPQSALYQNKSFFGSFFLGIVRRSAPQQLFCCEFGMQKRGGRWNDVFGDLSK